MEGTELLKEWHDLNAATLAARETRLANVRKDLGDHLDITGSAIALCDRALVLAFARGKGPTDGPLAALALWTLARATDCLRELSSGNIGGGVVLYRSVFEGMNVLTALLTDDSLAERFAAFEFIGQAKAREVIDPSHPKFGGDAPSDWAGQEGSSLLARLYDSLSSLAHPTRYAVALQSQPEPMDPSKSIQAPPGSLTLTWTLGPVAWPRTTEAALTNLFNAILQLVEDVRCLPMELSERELLGIERERLLDQAKSLWPTWYRGEPQDRKK